MTKQQEATATCKVCVFCGTELRLDEHVCLRCREYKGVELARKCPNCGQAVYVEDDECPDCGANMEAEK